jgi:regulator of sigma E protease
MEVLGTIVAFVAVLVILILVHEVGHFAAAKLSGITVEEFGIGFPPRAASLTWHGTRYSVNWIPLGGFVKMLGEDGDIEVRRLREQGLNDDDIEHALEGAFNRRPIVIRVGVLLAGVAMNFLLAIALFAMAFSVPRPVGEGALTVTQIQPGSPAAETSGLEVEDVILGADGQAFERTSELTEYLQEHAGTDVTLQVVRDDAPIDVVVVPRVLTAEELARGVGPVGFGYDPERIGEDPPLAEGPLDAIAQGASATWTLAIQIPGGLVEAVGGLLGLNPNAGEARGPIGIAQETGEVLDSPLFNQLLFVGLLSVNLAVLNVLPFPPLDGGRIAVVLLEAVRRRKLPAEREALIYLTGFAFLIALVILISIQDIQRLIQGS